MFEKIKEINFDTLNNLSFEHQKRKTEFQSYFNSMEKIYNSYLELEKYKDILSETDKTFLWKEIPLFSTILLNIQSKEWKKPDSRLNKEKYSPNYLNSLIQMNWRYKYFSAVLSKTKEEFDNKIWLIETEKTKIIEDKDAEIADYQEDLSILETQKKEKEDELNKKVSEFNIQKTELNKNIKDLKSELTDKELNKLARAFEKEELKYVAGSKKMIYFWFIILLIPSIIVIFILHNDITDYVKAIPFWILTVILWYFQYFQLKNYYINKDLETNFANRKAVANSFKWLLEMLNEEENFWDTTELKSKFFEKVSTILYAEIDTSYIKKHNDDVPTSKILDILNEVIKKIK